MRSSLSYFLLIASSGMALSLFSPAIYSNRSNGATLLALQSSKLVISARKLKFQDIGVGTKQTKDLLIENDGDSLLQGNVGSLNAPFSVVSGAGTFCLVPKVML